MHSQRRLSFSESASLRWLQYIFFGSAILYFGSSIFIPISFALLISFILFPICAWLERKGLSRLMAIVIAIIMLALLGFILIALLVNQFLSFLNEWPAIQIKM